MFYMWMGCCVTSISLFGERHLNFENVVELVKNFFFLDRYRCSTRCHLSRSFSLREAFGFHPNAYQSARSSYNVQLHFHDSEEVSEILENKGTWRISVSKEYVHAWGSLVWIGCCIESTSCSSCRNCRQSKRDEPLESRILHRLKCRSWMDTIKDA